MQVRVLFLALSGFLFVIQISPENGWKYGANAPYLHRRHVWSLAQTSLNVKDKGQGHHGQKTKNF